jgi:hypothetical protein
MVRTMLEELRLSSEPRYLVDAAMKYLRGLKGHLVQNKRLAKQRANGVIPPAVGGYAAGPGDGVGGVEVAPMYPDPNAAFAQGVRNGFRDVVNGGQQGPVQGSEAWNLLSVEDRLQGALAEFGAGGD